LRQRVPNIRLFQELRVLAAAVVGLVVEAHTEPAVVADRLEVHLLSAEAAFLELEE